MPQGRKPRHKLFTTLVSFDGTDGANSAAGLIRATDGNFYGTTSEGGANSDGTVFRISPSGVLTTLYSFCSKSACSDGANPVGRLIQATDGNLVRDNGDRHCLQNHPKWHADDARRHGRPIALAALVQGKDGNFYGTTSRGGANKCTPRSGYNVSCGTVFKITPTAP